jgi:ADP-ribose pyrophosphatase
LKSKPDYILEDSKEIFSGRIFDVILDSLRFAHGLELTMEVVRHGGAAAVVPVRDDGHLVLIRQYRYPVDKYIWEVPAGKYDDGEDSISCAAREMEEEVGYRAKEIEKIGSILTTPGFSDEKIDLYMARGLERTESNPDPDEFIDVVAVPIDQALDMIENGEVEDAKSIVAILMTAMKLSRS